MAVPGFLTILLSCVSPRRGSASPRHLAIDSSMISAPSNFVHLSHLGVDDFDNDKVMHSFNSFKTLVDQRNQMPITGSPGKQDTLDNDTTLLKDSVT